MIPLTVDVPMKRLPWANWGLVVVTITISLAVPAIRTEVVSSPPAQHAKPEDGFSRLQVREKLSPLVLKRDGFAAYQLVTSLFQHADLLHLFGNMLFLFVFGNAI